MFLKKYNLISEKFEKINHTLNHLMNETEEDVEILSKYKNYSGPVIYHSAKTKDLPNIFHVGASSRFFAKNCGNFYGAGLYTTIDLNSSVINAKRGEYGRNIVKFGLVDNGFYGYIIFIPQIAYKTYGKNWQIADQIKLLVGDVKITDPELLRTDLRLYNVEPTKENTPNTSAAAKILVTKYKDIIFNKIKGHIFKGETDGLVCVVRDAKSIIPIEYMSEKNVLLYDKTKKQIWDSSLLSTATIKNTIKQKDIIFHCQDKLKEKIKDWSPYINGYSLIYNNEGKCNYIDKNCELLFPIWLDKGFTLNPNKDYTLAEYKGETIYIVPEKKVFYFNKFDYENKVEEYDCADIEQLF